MYAHVITYRHATSAEVAAEMLPAIYHSGEFISDQSARAITSWYQSPNDNSRNITALSSGMPFDTAELISEINSQILSCDNGPDDFGFSDFDYGRALTDWVWNLEMILSD